NPIVVAQGSADANRNGFLTEGGMDEAGDLAGAVEAGNALLERSEEAHAGEQVDQSANHLRLKRHPHLFSAVLWRPSLPTHPSVGRSTLRLSGSYCQARESRE